MNEKIKLLLLGGIIGFVNGMFGAGGGMFLILCLEKFFHIPQKKAHATTTSIILPLSITSSCVMIKNYDLDWRMIFIISIGGIAGGFIGAKFLNKISASRLKKIFGLFVIFAAIKMIL